MIVSGIELSDFIKHFSGLLWRHLNELQVGEIVDALPSWVIQTVEESLYKNILWLSMSGTTEDEILVSISGASEGFIGLLFKGNQLLGLRSWKIFIGE